MAATIKDVAEFAGVGIGTVSRVINEEKSVKPATQIGRASCRERV